MMEVTTYMASLVDQKSFVLDLYSSLIEQLTVHYGRLNQFMHTHSATQTASNLPLDMFNQYLSFKVLNSLGLRSSLIMT